MSLLNILQAASNAVAGNVAGPVDLLAMGLRGVGVPVGDAPLGGTEWMRRRGLIRDVPQGASQVVGETLGLLGPIAAAAKAPQIAQGLLAVAGNAAAPRAAGPAAAQRGAIVWHGSPHKFDKFDSSKIGTGEGAQMYARGLYFSDSDKVADTYRARLASGDGGALYKVNIPDESIAAMIASDKPLRLQPEGVRNALGSLGFDSQSRKFASPEALHKAGYKWLSGRDASKLINSDLYAARDVYAARKAWNAGPESFDAYIGGREGAWLSGRLTKGEGGDKNAGAAYRELSRRLGGDAAASSALQAAGVPGVRFYDQGAMNSVVFDDRLPTILDVIGAR